MASRDPISDLIHWMDENYVWELASKIPDIWERFATTYSRENDLNRSLNKHTVSHIDSAVSRIDKKAFETSLREVMEPVQERIIKSIYEAGRDIVCLAPDRSIPDTPITVVYRREKPEMDGPIYGTSLDGDVE